MSLQLFGLLERRQLVSKAMKKKLKKTRETLNEEEKTKRRRVNALNKLNKMYDSIFERSTSGFLEEDLAESLVTE